MPALSEADVPLGGRRRLLRLAVVRRRVVAAAAVVARLPRPNFNLLAALFLGATGAYGTSLGGHTTAVIDSVAQPLGFSIVKVDVSGNSETSEIDALQALWSTGAQSLPALDPDAARRALEAMPWIESASVAKTYPDRVSIRLVEKRPYAVWQKERELFLVDREGREIMPYLVGRFQDLPFVVGPGANLHAAELLDGMGSFPELRARVRAYVRVGDRRWDLRMDNGVTVRLPEDGALAAAASVSRMDKDMGLLSRDIVTVDMRISDRIAVRLTPDAVVRRQAALKEREKQLRQARREKRA